jgi:hypothetical protein
VTAGRSSLQEKEALTRLLLLWFAGLAEDDASAADRDQVELQGEALAVVVIPRGPDPGPEGFVLRFFRDVPGDECRGFSLRGICCSCEWW